ncbi:transcriptional activator Mut3p [Fusarium subglutinans]|uniref:Transcriptional activator Mut3p n=1 Tax=Gibberella subglutinans TaxID=42677 RepID=A0A8H5PAS9_GIBSU|nr:transcriptional activator Mut3p [Fusarium subglutinans]KAF5593143.1 transcriptional activator Mut3p [Fusarium subglutinans]
MPPAQMTRKACDVCYRKRIRCDGQKPRCSHCVLYKSDCTFQATSRKAAIRKKASGPTAALQSQVQSLETSVDEAQQRIKELEARLTQKSSSRSDQPQLGEHDVSYSARASLDLGLELPPQHEVLSGVNKFLATFNTILPLFDPQRLLSRSQKDISIDWPSATPADGAGMLYTADDSSNFNFFLSRVQLAHIQGQVYEAMLSKSPTASDVYVRLDNVARIHQMLDDWLARIPSEFSASAITESGNTNLQRAFGVLYSSHLTCRSVVCKAHAMEAQWIPSLRDFGRKAVEQGIVATPRLPVGWHKLVHESREYIELFIAIDHKDPAFIW